MLDGKWFNLNKWVFREKEMGLKTYIDKSYGV